MIMRLRRLQAMLIMVAGSVAMTHAQCECGLFLVTSRTWRPDHLAFSTNKTYLVDCSDPQQASQECMKYCEEEVLALNQVFTTQPQLLQAYHPRQQLPCGALPAHTASFYTLCGKQQWVPASDQRSASVCCSAHTDTPVWCEKEASVATSSLGSSASAATSGRASSVQQTVIQRKIDTVTDQSSIHNNEIQGAAKPASQDEGSWLTNILHFFGYKSIGEMIQNIDIFSLPGKVQGLVKTYNDEISMGQCYMEFTTYSLFKQDGAFSSFLRTRREQPLQEAWQGAWSAEGTEDLHKRFASLLEEAWQDAWDVEDKNLEDKKSLQERFVNLLEEARAVSSHTSGPSTIESVVNGLVGLLEGSPTTRQYADVIRQIVPLVMQMYAAPDPSSAITAFITQAMGPYLAQVQSPSQSVNSISSSSSKPSSHWSEASSKPAPVPKTTPRPSSSAGAAAGSASSPITTMILQFLRYYMGNYLSSLPGNAPSKPPPPPQPTQAPAVSSTLATPSASSSSVGSILNLLFTPSRPQKVSRPKPQALKRPQKPQVLEKHDAKTFVDMVLEFIRPVFISIIGKAPGESGVASIREVTRLSSLGRVDDTVVEEVLSPYFCLKNYVVNKAWTLTERGVRSVASQFEPQEQARMMRMLQDY
ncbi:uncharacterized protein [Cherax quadricarinatus]|nr:uncharacterized protein LOC128692693 isoform X2 [Cherax quadricarinatus]